MTEKTRTSATEKARLAAIEVQSLRRQNEELKQQLASTEKRLESELRRARWIIARTLQLAKIQPSIGKTLMSHASEDYQEFLRKEREALKTEARQVGHISVESKVVR